MPPFSNGIMLFFVLQRGFYSYCKNEAFYDCTLCKQILLLLYTKLLLSGIHADRSIHFLTWSYVKKKYKLNVTNFLPFVDSFA